MSLLPDDVPANHTIWIIGDGLLTNAAGHYNTFKRRQGDPKASLELQQDSLYIENMYAIRIVPLGLYTTKQAQNLPNILLNALVDTLNIKAKVPHTLIVIINDHKFWNNHDLLEHQMERIIKRFIKEIRRIAEARNLSLPARAVNWDYPRIFITKALPLPNNMSKTYPKGFKPNRRRYNRLLQRGEHYSNYRAINLSDFTCENSNNFFNEDGSITPDGYKNFWITISDAVHKADNANRITLNKLRAKQLAAQITVTSKEMRDIHADDTISDIEMLQDTSDSDQNKPLHKQDKAKRPRRALLGDFNQSSDSPASTISEYFTLQHNSKSERIQGHRHKHFKSSNKIQQGSKFHGKMKHQRKSTWRDKQIINH